MAKKRSVRKRITHSSSLSSDRGVERILVENFISLQKVLTNLSERFDTLSSQISKLLELFEVSAKTLAEKDIGSEKEKKDAKKIIEKLDNLFEQNKIIARGLTLLHEPQGSLQTQPSSASQPFQQQTTAEPEKTKDINSETYQKSIYSGQKKR